MAKRITKITWAAIREGDDIRVDLTHGDMRLRREGVVYRIVSGVNEWSFVTKEGYELLRVGRVDNRGGALAPGTKVQLLNRSVDTPLFDL